MWFIIAGNALTALAYFAIPVALWYFIRKRPDIPFNALFYLFSLFILLCGTHHIVHIATFWYPIYYIQSMVDFATGVVSIITAVVLFRTIPLALKIPSIQEFQEKNENLQLQISKRQEAEAEVRTLNAELEQRVKDRTQEIEHVNQELRESEKRKDAFISMVSHELKTPITSLNGFVYALQKEIQPVSTLKINHYLAKIQEQVSKQTKLVTDIIEATRMDQDALPVQKNLININELIKNIVDEMQLTTDIHTIVVRGKSTKLVLADSEKIGQSLSNIISNAIKFSPYADTIIISVSEDPYEVTIKVQDFGLGIDEKHLNKIFNRYYRVDENTELTYPGLGVGLYITAQIIQQSNGRIWVESKREEGSSFYFTLPVAQG